MTGSSEVHGDAAAHVHVHDMCMLHTRAQPFELDSSQSQHAWMSNGKALPRIRRKARRGLKPVVLLALLPSRCIRTLSSRRATACRVVGPQTVLLRSST